MTNSWKWLGGVATGPRARAKGIGALTGVNVQIEPERYECSLSLERATPENGYRNGGNVLVRRDPGDPMVDFHFTVSGVGGSGSIYQRLTPDEAQELAAALKQAADREEAEEE